MKRVSLMMLPRIALIAVMAMVILYITLPLPIVAPLPFSYTGVAATVAGVSMIAWSRRAFQAGATPITPFTESTALIRHSARRWL